MAEIEKIKKVLYEAGCHEANIDWGSEQICQLFAHAASIVRKEEMLKFHAQLRHYLDTAKTAQEAWDDIDQFCHSLEGELKALKNRGGCQRSKG